MLDDTPDYLSEITVGEVIRGCNAKCVEASERGDWDVARLYANMSHNVSLALGVYQSEYARKLAEEELLAS